MATDYPELYAEKHSLVKELFISTADDNYTLARWCFHHNVNVDFFWLAVHCLEKYLKAALLMNGKSSKGFSHNISKLFKAVKPLAPELLPDTTIKPPNMPEMYWRNETVIEFIERLHKDGQADNRYLIYGYGRNPEDLFKLDQIVFSVRRLAQSLEVRFIGAGDDGLPKSSLREVMAKRPEKYWNLQSKLEDTMSGKRGDDLKQALLHWNFPFAPADHQHKRTSYISAYQNPLLMTRIYDPLEYGQSKFPAADKLWDWVKSNIQLPTTLVSEMEARREEIKAATIAAKRE